MLLHRMLLLQVTPQQKLLQQVTSRRKLLQRRRVQKKKHLLLLICPQKLLSLQKSLLRRRRLRTQIKARSPNITPNIPHAQVESRIVQTLLEHLENAGKVTPQFVHSDLDLGLRHQRQDLNPSDKRAI
jgi:hypothetical protein